MDALPTETVAHVLSFLKGEDLLKSKQLNSRFQRIIDSDRKVLQYPLLNLDVGTPDDSAVEKVNIFLHWKWGCVLNVSDPHKILIRPTSSQRKLLQFFGNSIKNNQPNCSLEYSMEFSTKLSLDEIFRFIFAKINVNWLEVGSLLNKQAYLSVIKAITESPAPVRNVHFSRCIRTAWVDEIDVFPQVCGILEAVAHQKRKSKVYPRMNFYVYGYDSGKLTRINELALLYKKTTMRIRYKRARNILPRLARDCMEHRIAKFNFTLEIDEGKAVALFDLPLFATNCEVKSTNFTNFYFNSSEPEDASIEVTHISSRKVLTFMKENGAPGSCYVSICINV